MFLKYVSFVKITLEGSPFHPKIIDPCKVEVVSSMDNWTDVDRVTVWLDELQSIMFDCMGAGPGEYMQLQEQRLRSF